MIALFCALAIVPGVVHARVCLVALGAIEKSDCCPAGSCCEAEPSDVPALSASEMECHCCLDFDLEPSEKPLLTSVPASLALFAPSLASEVLPSLMPPPGIELSRCALARAAPRPRPAAPLPLRI